MDKIDDFENDLNMTCKHDFNGLSFREWIYENRHFPVKVDQMFEKLCKKSDYIDQVCNEINDSRNQPRHAIIDGIMKGFLDVQLISLKIIKEINKSMSLFLNQDDMNFAFNMCKSEIVKKVVGKNGYYFKMTTQKQGVKFIWYSVNKDQIYVWGNKYNIINSLNVLYKRFSDIIINLWSKIISFSSLIMAYEKNQLVFENCNLESAKILNMFEEENHPFSIQNSYFEDLELDAFNSNLEEEQKGWGDLAMDEDEAFKSQAPSDFNVWIPPNMSLNTTWTQIKCLQKKKEKKNGFFKTCYSDIL